MTGRAAVHFCKDPSHLWQRTNPPVIGNIGSCDQNSAGTI